MATYISNFDPIEYSKKLRNAGVSQEIADIQAQAMEKIISDIAINQELVIKKELAELKLELIKWILATGVGTILALAGLIKFMVHS